MPVENSVGYSDNAQVKYPFIEYFLSVHAKISFALMARRPWAADTYYYVDLNAGPGVVNDNIGSPLIALRAIRPCNTEWHRAFFYFVDRNGCAARSLRRRCVGSDICILQKDNAVALSEISRLAEHTHSRKVFGLVFSDDNGNNQPFSAIREWSRCRRLSTMDFLMHYCACGLKRCRRSPLTGREEYLDQELARIEKEKWFIRVPFSAYQWTFIFGTNYSGFPDLKNLGFFGISSVEGRLILKYCTYTRDEMAGYADVRKAIRDLQRQQKKQWRRAGDEETHEVGAGLVNDN